MTADSANLEALSTRQGFNSAVRYIQKTIEISSSAGSGNLGDILRELGNDDTSGGRIGLLLRMLLVDKLGYKTASANLSVEVAEPAKFAAEFEKWKGVDLVAAYHHPELGLLIANPKVAEELGSFGQLRKRELMVIYAGLRGKETDDNCQKAASLALNVFEGAKITVPPALTKGTFAAPVKKWRNPLKPRLKSQSRQKRSLSLIQDAQPRQW